MLISHNDRHRFVQYAYGMETNIQTLSLLDADLLENQLQKRMGRELTRQERFYVTIASACSREGHPIPEGLLEQGKRPS